MVDKIPNVKFTGTKVVLVNSKTQQHKEITINNVAQLLFQVDDLNDWILFYAVPIHEEITEEVTNG